MRAVAISAALLLTHIGASAQEEKGVEAHLTASPMGSGAVMETIAGLLVIVVLIFALGWLLRRFGGLSTAGKGGISVLGGVSLGPRERAVLLQVGKTRLLVGVAPGRVQTLHVITDESNGNGNSDFSNQLDAELGEVSK